MNGQVEIHFVLRNVPSEIEPGSLTYTYSDGSTTHTATISPSNQTGNVWHYYDYQSSGYYNVISASVTVNGQTVTLHNPGDYAGSYCAVPTNTTSPTVEPTQVTPTAITPTEVTPTEVTPTEITPTEVTSTPTEVTPTEITPTETTPTEVTSTPTEVTPTEITPTEVTSTPT
ncbi:MAG: hypothetical protein ACPLRU_09155, partial [Desulfofundulus sp.]